MKSTLLRTTIRSALGIAALASSSMASAAVTYYDWNGVFTMLDPGGAALSNTSLGKYTNTYQDNLSGTLAFDDVTGAGTVTASSFYWGQGTSPMSFSSFKLQAVGDGMGGAGTLIVGNMLMDWSGNAAVPVSIVLDGSGFFAGELSSGGPMSAVPSSDGTYVGIANGTPSGYLQLGPVPLATTDFNTSNISPCAFNDCDGLSTSGGLPLIVDTATNDNRYDLSTPATADLLNGGIGIGGSPMQDGPFQGFNFNFDFIELTEVSVEPAGYIAPQCEIGIDCLSVVPIPAAVWLFGSGLLGIAGLARKKHQGGFSSR